MTATLENLTRLARANFPGVGGSWAAAASRLIWKFSEKRLGCRLGQGARGAAGLAAVRAESGAGSHSGPRQQRSNMQTRRFRLSPCDETLSIIATSPL
jgi:hypothetical protein